MVIRCPGQPAQPSRRRRRDRHAVTGVATAVALLVGACAGSDDAADPAPPGSAADTGDNPSGCSEDVGAGEGLFPDTYEIEHATNLSLSYEDTYKVMRIGETSPGAGEQVYVLAQCGTEAPTLDGELAGATVVDIPVTSLHAESPSHLGFLDALGAADVVTGVGDPDLVTTPGIRERIDDDDVTAFAPGGVLDAEQVIADDPDVLVTGGVEGPAHETIAESGVPVVANAEWLETSPQGWSEWIAFFAALTNTEARATRVHDELVAGYGEAAALAAGVDERPSVLTGGLRQGRWSAQGGAGIVAQFIDDAGGDYVYAADTVTGSITRDIEQVLTDAADADVWLVPPPGLTNRADAVAADERYGGLAAWDAGGVWANDEPRRGGVSLLEAGPVRIDDYLRDYVKILHPELVPDHELVFFRRLPAT